MNICKAQPVFQKSVEPVGGRKSPSLGQKGACPESREIIPAGGLISVPCVEQHRQPQQDKARQQCDNWTTGTVVLLPVCFVCAFPPLLRCVFSMCRCLRFGMQSVFLFGVQLPMLLYSLLGMCFQGWLSPGMVAGCPLKELASGAFHQSGAHIF